MRQRLPSTKRPSTICAVSYTHLDDSTGLQRGDRIISINDTEVSSSSDITNCINSLVVGDNVKLVVMRHGKTVEVTLTLKEKTQGTSSSESN